MVASPPGTKDGAMNETQNPSGPPPPPQAPPADQAGPRVSGQQMRDVRRLRRSRTDRKLAGVAGGLGRHLDIDPTVIRVVIAVLCFFGGAGFLLYAAAWLLVPEEGKDRAVLNTSDDLQKGLLIGVAFLAVFFAFGQTWGGSWSGFPLALIVMAALVWLVLRDRRREAPAPPAYAPYAGQTPATYAAAPGTPVGTTGTEETAPVGQVPTEPDVPGAGYPPPPARPAWAPPPYVAPPPRPRRTGLVLFWPTLALIAVALGVLGIYDSTGHVVEQSAYPALALAVIGVMLVVGAFVGRPGGLPLIGVIAALTLALGNVTGGFHEGRSATYTPLSSDTVRPTYDMKTGELVLDLTRVSDLRALEGRSVQIEGNTGRIEVIVPEGLTVDVDADIQYAGGITIGDDNNGGGINPSASETLGGHFGDPTLDLAIDLRVGEIEVRQR